MSSRDDHLLKSLMVFEERLLENHRQARRRQTKFRAGLILAALSLAALFYTYSLWTAQPATCENETENNEAERQCPAQQHTQAHTWSYSTAFYLILALVAWNWASDANLFRRISVQWYASSEYIQRCNRALSHVNLVIGETGGTTPSQTGTDSTGSAGYQLVLPVEPVQRSFEQYKRDHRAHFPST